MTASHHRLSLILGLLALAACEDPYQPTLHADYAIRVVPTAQGDIAVPPTCPSWRTEIADPFDNQPIPQFGCASARNLAAMIENPDDLVKGRALSNARGVTAVGAMRRFDNDQTRGLVLTGTETNQAAASTSSTNASGLSGDITGGGSAGSSAGATSGMP